MFLTAAYGPPPAHPHDPTDDHRLVVRIRTGNESDARAAFEALFATYGTALIEFARSQLGDRAKAEDVVHDVFVSVWIHRTQWVVRGTPRTYLYQAVRHRVINARRDAHVRAHIGIPADDEARHAAAAPDRSDAAVTDWELRRILDQAIFRLPPRNREVFLLVRAQHLSHAEAAEILGISINAVAVHMRRALDVLRAVVAEYQR